MSMAGSQSSVLGASLVLCGLVMVVVWHTPLPATQAHAAPTTATATAAWPTVTSLRRPGVPTSWVATKAAPVTATTEAPRRLPEFPALRGWHAPSLAVLALGLAAAVGAALRAALRPTPSEWRRGPAAAAIATALTAATLGGVSAPDAAQAFPFLPPSEQDIYRDAWKAVQGSFIDKSYNGHDWNQVLAEEQAKTLTNREETYAEIRSSLDLLGDPFTRLLEPPQYDNIKRRLTGRLTGVGLEIVPVAKDGVNTAMKVVDRTLDGPADKAGIRDGDLIVAVNGAPIEGRSQWVIANALVGDRDAEVTLTVVTPGQDPRPVALKRDSVTFQAVKFGLCDQVPNQTLGDKTIEHLGYVRVPSFNFSTASEFNKALKELTKQGADGVVIDLRNDTGGSLSAAYEMANSVLPSGEIVRVVSGDGTVTSAQVKGRAPFADLPVVLLVNDLTASSSEVLAAGLKTAGRAVIAGEQTFGKGIIQDIKQLPDGSALFVTKERYLTPANEEIDKVGIAPTVAVPKDLLDTKTGLRTEPAQFCEDVALKAPPLFSGPPPPPFRGPHGDVDLNTLSAFC